MCQLHLVLISSLVSANVYNSRDRKPSDSGNLPLSLNPVPVFIRSAIFSTLQSSVTTSKVNI